jgi:sarcosine oxidase
MDEGMQVTESHDLIVAGLGAVGSAIALHAARAGASVLGFDRYAPPHAYGSTHGDTRIFRVAIGEGGEYVPLARRSQQIWRQIERETGAELLVQCGGLIAGVHSTKSQHGVDDFLNQTVRTARRYGIEHEELTAADIKQRYPQFGLTDEDGYFEPTAGFVRPEAAVAAQLELARRHGAGTRFGERLVSFTSDAAGVTVVTTRGRYRAGKLVMSVGPWIGDFVPRSVFQTYRQVLYWFGVDPDWYAAYRDAPVFIWEFGHGPADFVYGLPALDGAGGGVKLASESYDIPMSPDGVRPGVTKQEKDAFYGDYVKGRFAGLTDVCLRAVSCLYTVTPDYRFVIDTHPDSAHVIVASPCSGHGFKHSAAVGEAVAQLALSGRSDIDLDSFRLERFGRDQGGHH